MSFRPEALSFRPEALSSRPETIVCIPASPCISISGMKRLVVTSLTLLALLWGGYGQAQGSGSRLSDAAALVGSFEGPLVLGRDNMNLAFTFGIREGEYTAVLISSGLGIYGMPADTIRVNGLKLLLRIPRLDLEFTGTLRLNESGDKVLRIDGDWFQYSEMVPVVLLPVDAPSF